MLANKPRSSDVLSNESVREPVREPVRAFSTANEQESPSPQPATLRAAYGVYLRFSPHQDALCLSTATLSREGAETRARERLRSLSGRPEPPPFCEAYLACFDASATLPGRLSLAALRAGCAEGTLAGFIRSIGSPQDSPARESEEESQGDSQGASAALSVPEPVPVVQTPSHASQNLAAPQRAALRRSRGRSQEWPCRERALREAYRASDAELVACLIGEDVPVTAGLMVREHGLGGLFCARDARELARYPRVGAALAARFAAVAEIARRLEAAPAAERYQVRSPADVAALYGPLLRDLKVEVFKVVFLNTANVITGELTVSEGGLSASIAEPRAIFRQAILENAAAVLFLHNHPSGNPEPSREDVRVTKQLTEAGRLVGISVHDHLIIAGRAYTSLAERGLMHGA